MLAPEASDARIDLVVARPLTVTATRRGRRAVAKESTTPDAGRWRRMAKHHHEEFKSVVVYCHVFPGLSHDSLSFFSNVTGQTI